MPSSGEHGKTRLSSSTTLPLPVSQQKVERCTRFSRSERSSDKSSSTWGGSFNTTVRLRADQGPDSRKCLPTDSSRVRSGTLTPCSCPNSIQLERCRIPSTSKVCQTTKRLENDSSSFSRPREIAQAGARVLRAYPEDPRGGRLRFDRISSSILEGRVGKVAPEDAHDGSVHGNAVRDCQSARRVQARKDVLDRPSIQVCPLSRLYCSQQLTTFCRNETADATHLAEFHQVEGVVADYDITLGDLIGKSGQPL